MSAGNEAQMERKRPRKERIIIWRREEEVGERVSDLERNGGKRRG